MSGSVPRIRDGFEALVAPFEIAILDRLPSPACGLSADLSIEYINPAWISFGRANGATEASERGQVGAKVLDAAPTALRPFYERMFARAREANEPVDHDYECSSDAVHRVFRMRVHPCASGAFVVVHSLLREAPHTGAASAPLEELYRDARGLVVQCSNCRRVRRAGTTDMTEAEWDWVPDFVAQMPPRTSHGLCAVCDAYYSS